jgi:hypothetical protein
MIRPDVAPDAPAHTPGTAKGEERLRTHGREPGRADQPPNRKARDATSISPQDREPIDPRMPELPPP